MFYKNIFSNLINKLKEERDSSVTTNADKRLLLVIKARWFLITLLLIYGVLSASAYAFNYLTRVDNANNDVIIEALRLMIYPGIVVLTLAAYNAIYHISWYKLPHLWKNNVKKLIFAQLAADIPIVLLLIHFTGGIHSWFWTLFLVINLELTYLLIANWQILFIGMLTGLSYSTLSILEHFGYLKVYQFPYLTPVLDNPTYLVLMLFWVNLICGFACLVSIFLQKSEHSELKDRINKDALTDLYNRRYFNQKLASEIQRAKRYNRVISIILFDIDNFKKYNDTYGHVQGDILLRWVADVFKLNIRRRDEEPVYEIDIPCRYGGEEFAIILPETSSSSGVRLINSSTDSIEKHTTGAVALAERIRKNIEDAEMVKGKITLSAGIAFYPLSGTNEKELIEAADKALYKAKNTGKNKIVIAKKKIDRRLSKHLLPKKNN